MILLQLSQIEKIVQATSKVNFVDCDVESVSIDSRKENKKGLFVALSGETFDGHDFVENAIQNGAVALIVERELATTVPQLIVADSRIALGKVAHWVRAQVPAKVVALTGSSGKTSVKEMVAAILQEKGKVLYTEGNFNNDIGVPLTLLRLTESHQFAVIELGANRASEIAYTVSLVQPESVLINNIAASHLEGFGSLEGVADAKIEILQGLVRGGRVVLNRASQYPKRCQAQLDGYAVWYFSLQKQAAVDFYVENLRSQEGKLFFILHTPIGSIDVMLPLLGKHNVANVLAASALAISVGASLDNIAKGLTHLKAIPGRLYPIKLRKTQWLLDDTYNANVSSMIAAAETLADIPGYTLMIVGDMGELGEHSQRCHEDVGYAIQKTTIDQVFSLGQYSHFITQLCGRGTHFYDLETLTNSVVDLLNIHDAATILIKGSRSSAMERVIDCLREKLAC